MPSRANEYEQKFIQENRSNIFAMSRQWPVVAMVRIIEGRK